jgi:hypothetical protein
MVAIHAVAGELAVNAQPSALTLQRLRLVAARFSPLPIDGKRPLMPAGGASSNWVMAMVQAAIRHLVRNDEIVFGTDRIWAMRAPDISPQMQNRTQY